MTTNKPVTFYLPAGLRDQAEQKNHNFLNIATTVLQTNGFEVCYVNEGNENFFSDSYSLHHMQESSSKNGLTFRRACLSPFWQIDRTNRRWDWGVAKASFDPSIIDQEEARKFFRLRCRRLFGTLFKQITRDGFIYVPLQGKLLDHRSFQRCSPIDMIETTLSHAKGRRVVVTLHPYETYSDRELDKLHDLERRVADFELVSTPMDVLLQSCDFVVTQNSTVGFLANFFRKPTIFFAGIDFHHIGESILRSTAQEAFDAISRKRSYAPYVWWYLQKMSINAASPDAYNQVTQRLRALGWPLSDKSSLD